jgi:hypothetical protein
MFRFIRLCLGMLVRFFRVRQSLLLENLALRQQLAVLNRRRQRPCLSPFDKLFWVAVSRFWSGWKQALVVVTPETVIRWHRAGFRLYWKLISRVGTRVGRKPTPKEVRELIFRMVVENPTWGAPRIHGELLRQAAKLLAGVSATSSSFEMVEYRACTSILIPTIQVRMRYGFDGVRTVSGEVDNHS